MTGPTPPGTGVRAAATRDRGRPVDIAHDGAIDDIDAAVHDEGAGSEHRPVHQPGTACGHDQDVGPRHFRGQVAGLPVADRDRGVVAQQQQLGGLAHHVAAPDDDRVPPGQVVTGAKQDLDRGLGA